MTEEKFNELVNLYLDKEISTGDLADLKADLAINSERKAEFTERCRLNQAMRLAMNSKSSQHHFKSNRAGSSRHSRKSQAVSPRLHQNSIKAVTFPRWMAGIGCAASLVVGLVLLRPVFYETVGAVSSYAHDLVNFDEFNEVDPLDEIGRSELRRFAAIQDQRAVNQRASIAAQFRLMGLSPELTPDEKQLRSISAIEAKRPEPMRNAAELLAGVQQMEPMPTPKILREESLRSESVVYWPSGFHSTLASFK